MRLQFGRKGSKNETLNDESCSQTEWPSNQKPTGTFFHVAECNASEGHAFRSDEENHPVVRRETPLVTDGAMEGARGTRGIGGSRTQFIPEHIGEYRSLNKHRFGQFGESSESLSVSVHCSNHSPRGILIHPMEDLCLGLLLAPLLRPGSFF